MTNNRMMNGKLGIGETVVNIICMYTLLKWAVNRKRRKPPADRLTRDHEGESVIVGGFINGRVGISREAIERIHGGLGVGKKNEKGKI